MCARLHPFVLCILNNRHYSSLMEGKDRAPPSRCLHRGRPAGLSPRDCEVAQTPAEIQVGSQSSHCVRSAASPAGCSHLESGDKTGMGPWCRRGDQEPSERCARGVPPAQKSSLLLFC